MEIQGLKVKTKLAQVSGYWPENGGAEDSKNSCSRFPDGREMLFLPHES